MNTRKKLLIKMSQLLHNIYLFIVAWIKRKIILKTKNVYF